MKKLFVILGITLLIIGAIVVVTGYNQHNSQSGKGYDIKCVQPSQQSPTPNTFVCAIDTRQEAKQSQENSSAWDVLTTWPESITAWLLLLTLIAISWQAWETREAAQAAVTQAAIANKQFIATFRTRVRIRKMELVQNQGNTRILFTLVNIGQSVAHVSAGLSKSMSFTVPNLLIASGRPLHRYFPLA